MQIVPTYQSISKLLKVVGETFFRYTSFNSLLY